MLSPPIKFPVDLTGRTALVTGASAGLGARFAQILGACGASVALVGRRPEKLAAVAAGIVADGGIAVPVVLDVSRSADIASAVDDAERQLGIVDILVNNAGAPGGGFTTKMPPGMVDQVFDTNLRGPWVLSCEVARRLIAAKKPGWMVNIASMGAFSYDGAIAAALYATTKGGLVRMTEVLAKEWAHYHINVNAIAPGAFSSEMMDGMIERIGDDFLNTGLSSYRSVVVIALRRVPARRAAQRGLVARASGSTLPARFSEQPLRGGRNLPPGLRPSSVTMNLHRSLLAPCLTPNSAPSRPSTYRMTGPNIRANAWGRRSSSTVRCSTWFRRHPNS